MCNENFVFHLPFSFKALKTKQRDEESTGKLSRTSTHAHIPADFTIKVTKVIRRQNETTWSLKYNRYGLRLAFKKIILHIKATSASVVNENLTSNVGGDSFLGWRYFMLSEKRFSNDF